MMQFLQQLFFNNYLILLPVLSWLAAQILKVILHLIMHREFRGERLLGAGGMPSSHSALVCSLFVGTARKYGASSPHFAFAFALAVIVMYDAMGVRRETGKQAQVLNQIMDDLKEEDSKLDATKKLKEMVGHTPLQVLFGGILGVVLALIIPVF